MRRPRRGGGAFGVDCYLQDTLTDDSCADLPVTALLAFSL